MHHFRSSLRSSLALVAGLAVLIGCESSSGPDSSSQPEAKAPLVAKGTLELSESAVLPDSGVWRTTNPSRSDSGRGRVACVVTLDKENRCSESFGLDSILGGDLIVQDLYALGLHYATVMYSQDGNDPNLVLLEDSTRIRSLEDGLLRGFLKTYRGAHPEGAEPAAEELLAYYAELLLKSDSTVFRKSLPSGMSEDSARKMLVLIASQQGIPADLLASRNLLGLSSDSIHALMTVLVKESRITDTTSLYPRFLVRLVDTMEVASDLVAGGESVPVDGSFSWTPNRSLRRIEVVVKSDKGVEDSVTSRFGKDTKLDSGFLRLTGNLSLRAAKGARPGWDTLVVSLEGDSSTVTLRAAFRVVRGDSSPSDTVRQVKDSIPPMVKITRPRGDTSVPSDVESFVLQAEITDDKALASVRFGDRAIASAPWRDTVRLAEGRNVLIVTAKDSSGNVAADTVVVERAKAVVPADTARPGIAAPADRTVGASDSTIELVWKISGIRNVARITLNNDAVAVDTVVARKLPLKAGANPFVLVVVDSSGRVVTSTVVITRREVELLPSIEPLPDREVGLEDTSTTLEWLVVNSGKVVSASINGSPIQAGANIRATVLLKDSVNRFVLMLRDSLGRGVSDTVHVFRKIDRTGPIIAWISPTSSTSVEYPVSSYLVKVRANDPSGVDSVMIQGRLATRDGDGVWSASIDLPRGDTVGVLVEVSAIDGRRNVSRDSITIVRKRDVIGPVVRFVVPGRDTTVHSQVVSLELYVAANDSGSGLASLTIGGKDALATRRANFVLESGRNVFIATATDSAGNSSSDTMVVTRQPALPAPTFSPVPGTFASPQIVTISAPPGATIRYTTDGTIPTMNSATLGPDSMRILVGSSTKLQVFAVATGYGNSPVVSGVYTIKDEQAPSLRFVRPSVDTTLPYGTASLDVEVEASDSGSGLMTVTIGGKVATGTKRASLALLAGRNVLIATAADSAGNRASDTLVVTVAADTTHPRIAWVSDMSKLVVGISAPDAPVAWTVTDNDLDQVDIGNVIVAPSNSVYTRVVKVSSDNQRVVVRASDRSGNFSKDSVTLRLVVPPTIVPDGGEYTTTKTVEIAAPLGRIDYQVNGGAWIAYTGPFVLSSTTLLRARAVHEGVVETTDTVRYVIEPDASMPSLLVNGNKIASISTNFSTTLPLFTASAYVEATPKDTTAKVSIGGVEGKSRKIDIVGPSTSVEIVVTNGGVSKTFTLTLSTSFSGMIADVRDGGSYNARRIGDAWWLMEDLRYAGTEQSVKGNCPGTSCDTVGRVYNWNEAVGGIVDFSEPALCPDGWTVPSSSDWGSVPDVETSLAIKYVDGTANFWTREEVDIENATKLYISGGRTMWMVAQKSEDFRIRCIRQ